ncbi:MAG: hypothetical protein GXY83_27775 [Rhodopirellula sp.]|nr:hypothetical protein [Rhodopirellula sp.]
MSRRFGVWYSWMQSLAKAGPWPDEAQWDKLRCDDFAIIGKASERSGYIGLVYADGNAMGRLVQELDAAETCQSFSDLVDSSIRNACFHALEAVLKSEVDAIRRSVASGLRPKPVPADILLLGGDDLMVVLPADRALSFALTISEHFERLTQEAIAKQSGACRKFFQDRLKDRGLTISCGVAVGRANYPFYLLLNLAEELLQNAKRAGHAARQKEDLYAMPSFLDFHVVAGAASHELKHVREDDYFTETKQSRTLRPLSHGQLLALQQAVAQLRSVRFPRSKLHDLFEAALDPSPSGAEHRLREIFSRCRDTERQPERWSLWQAVAQMSPRHDVSNFPWLDQADKRITPIADLVEAYDLFPSKEEA